jgi:hypothetical protein
MKRIATFTGLLALAALAHAQNNVSWVASTGIDINTCVRTSPCRTLAVAYAKTEAAGTIRMVDAADYGPLVISKAITLDGGTSGGMVGGGSGNAITVTPGYNDMINLRNFAIHMAGPYTGIVVHSGGLAVINVENVSITADDLGGGILVNSDGRDFSTDTQVRVRNVSVAGTAIGVVIGNGRFTAEHLAVDTRSDALLLRTNLFHAVIRDSAFHSTNNGVAVSITTDDQTIFNRNVLIEHSDMSQSTTGVYVCQNKPAVKVNVRLTDNVITANGVGVFQCNGQQLVTFRNNVLEGNSIDGTLVNGSTFK